MFFKRHAEPVNRCIEEELDILSNRLNDSIYYEDRLDALNEILKASRTHPVEVGICALQSVINSMREMEDVSIHIEVIKNTLECRSRMEFIDIIVSNHSSLGAICSCIQENKEEENIYDLLYELSISEAFPKCMPKIPNAAYYCVHMVKKKKTELISRLIECDVNFKKELTFAEVFENTLEVLRNGFSKEMMALLVHLLKDCTFNQNYFNELNWDAILKYRATHQNETDQVLSSLIDLKNPDFPRIQCSVHKRIEMQSLVNACEWRLIYLIIKDNAQYTQEALSLISSENIANACNQKAFTRRNDAYLLADYLLMHDSFDLPEHDSYRIYTLKCFHGRQLSLESIASKMISEIDMLDRIDECSVLDLLVFVIFNFQASWADKITIKLVEIFNDYTRPNIHRSLCLIALMMLDTPIDSIGVNQYAAAHILRETRLQLCSLSQHPELYMTDHMVDTLIDNVNDLILTKCT
ncbi:hypothetical protein M896_090120 [Ordospora colligata OC4]|uniref:Uncharacterized protein n=1 Tax=Ordospora colligata OC4 TaxID=1354746 RepID=A0A0B2UIM3_9MICR|nr:uncharacterized protein M896_090120 [Ordospora colligata OC4]KHN69089.1 hypothetical protein M896_090120 [Ordospora colligata OC4]TBU14544.1 hypothetical protein CWI41_090120 [Ordospora colligata]